MRFGLERKAHNPAVVGHTFGTRCGEFQDLPWIQLIQQVRILDHHFEPMVQLVNELEDMGLICLKTIVKEGAHSIHVPDHNAAVITPYPLFIRHAIRAQGGERAFVGRNLLQASGDDGVEINVQHFA